MFEGEEGAVALVLSRVLHALDEHAKRRGGGPCYVQVGGGDGSSGNT